MNHYRTYRTAKRMRTRRYVIDSLSACAYAYPDAANAIVSRKVAK